MVDGAVLNSANMVHMFAGSVIAFGIGLGAVIFGLWRRGKSRECRTVSTQVGAQEEVCVESSATSYEVSNQPQDLTDALDDEEFTHVDPKVENPLLHHIDV